MKKLISILLAAAMAVSLAACKPEKQEDESAKNNEVQNEEVAVYEDVDLVALADSLYDGLTEDERPMTMSMSLDAETFESFAFIPYDESLKAVVNEPMMGSIAHSIVLVECPDKNAAEKVASDMKEKCDPRKWICVEADVVKTSANKNIAMLLMTSSEGGMAETILANFAKFDGKLPEKENPENEVDETEVVNENVPVEDVTKNEGNDIPEENPDEPTSSNEDLEALIAILDEIDEK